MKFFENLKKEFKRLAGEHDVRVKVNLDDAGYLDQTCPHEPCRRGFKLKNDDKDKVGSSIWCVYCGHKADTAEFLTAAQAEHFRATVTDHAARMVNQAFRRAAMATPRTSTTHGGKYSSVTITETVTPPPELRQPDREPPEAWAVMRVEASCDACGCRFAGIGGCFFCPACGHRSTDLTFTETLRGIRDGLAKQEQLEVAVGRDESAYLMTKVAESGILFLVTAFESFAKDSFQKLAPTAPPPRRNVFQNLRDGSELWSKHGGRAFDSNLTADELQELSRYFQQRHVLAHKNGIVDDDYGANASDTTYEVGQRLAIKPEQVLRMADLVEKLVASLREHVR